MSTIVGVASDPWRNASGVEKGNNQLVKDSFEAARKKKGAVKLTALKDFEVIALEAQLKKPQSFGDRAVDLGGGETLIQRDEKVYLKRGEQYFQVTGYEFPPQRMG